MHHQANIVLQPEGLDNFDDDEIGATVVDSLETEQLNSF
jgi:hypothetical protein